MGVTIDESGKESGLAEIDSCGVFGSVILDLFPRTNFLDALPVGQNALIEQVASTLDLKHAPRFDQLGSWRRGWFESKLCRHQTAKGEDKANTERISWHRSSFFAAQLQG